MTLDRTGFRLSSTLDGHERNSRRIVASVFVYDDNLHNLNNLLRNTQSIPFLDSYLNAALLDWTTNSLPPTKLMAASSSGNSSAQPSRDSVAPGVSHTEPASTSSPHGSKSTSRLNGVSRTLFAPFQHRKRNSHQILADRTCSSPSYYCPCAVEPTPSFVPAHQSLPS